jgi:ferredoxin
MIPFSEFSETAKKLGYDLVGVPPNEAFDKLAPSENPLNIYPDAKSIAVVGRRIRRGIFRSMEEGSLWAVTHRWITGMDNLVRWIEKQGHECVPYSPGDPPNMPKQVISADAKVRPNGFKIPIEYAAVAAGLGELGYHGIFMSPQFGIRQQLGLLATDLVIEPGPGWAKDSKPICDMCGECAKACPLNAYATDQTALFNCNGREMTVAAINAKACQACPNGSSGDAGYVLGSEELHREVVNNQFKGDKANQFMGGRLPNRLMAACGRACIAHFEKTHDTGYKIPFRIREPWGYRPDQEQEG